MSVAAERSTSAGSPVCAWINDNAGLAVALGAQRTIDDLRALQATRVDPIEVGPFTGRRLRETGGPGFCRIDLAVASHSTVLLESYAINNTEHACFVVDEVALAVARELDTRIR